MNFSTPDRVADVIQRMLDSDEWRGENQTRIHSHFNGNPPWTDDECEELKIQYNVPWGEGPGLMDNARGMWETAFNSKEKYFSVRGKNAPPEKRIEWSLKVTDKLAEIMKRSREYTDCTNSEGAMVLMDGYGPKHWENPDVWAPYPVAVEDMKFPSRTLTSFSNLAYFAIMTRYTPFELYKQAIGEYAHAQWNKGLVRKILAALSNVNSEQTDWTQYQFPARLEEDFKSNSGYWGSDCVPTINCWKFFHRGENEQSKDYYLKIVLDWDQPTLGGTGNISANANQYIIKGRKKASEEGKGAKKGFLYVDSDPYAKSLDEIIHVTFANGAHVAPFRVHSVRGFGYRLYRPSITLDKMRNKAVEAWFVELLQIFKNVPAEDREKLEMIYLANFGVMPQGATYLPQNERYRPDLNTVISGINTMRELMSESAATYVQNSEGADTERETATKTMARLQQANRMVGNFLSKAYDQKRHEYREICRRFCRRNSIDPDVKEFQAWAQEEEIPEEFLKVEDWEITPERTIASGDRMLASSMADKLMGQYPRYDPNAQKLLLRIFTEINSDVDLAGALVKLDEDEEASPTVIQAYNNLGPLMEGFPAPMSRSSNQIEYIETLLQGMSQKVQQIERQGGMTDEKTVLGLFTVGSEIQKRIGILEQDKFEKQRARVYGDALKRLMNEVRAYAQRLQEQAKKRGQQLSPEIQAKMQATVIAAQSNAKIKEASSAQKMRHKEQGFWMEQRRRDKDASFELARKAREADLDAAALDLKTEAEIRNGSRKQMASFDEGE